MRPFSMGWEKLSQLERLAIWLGRNKEHLRGSIPEYRRLLENFYISCNDPKIEDYWNFLSDIRFYPRGHQDVLINGFFAVYNTSLALLELKSIEVIDLNAN